MCQVFHNHLGRSVEQRFPNHCLDASLALIALYPQLLVFLVRHSPRIGFLREREKLSTCLSGLYRLLGQPFEQVPAVAIYIYI